MRVAILAPHYYRADTGNSITVKRIERHLRLQGCEVRVYPIDQLSTEKLLSEVKKFAPQLLHAFHGYHGGRVAHALSKPLCVPYLVTLTGTDVYQALCDQRSHQTHEALRGASRIVVFHGNVKRCLCEHLPSLAERTVVIRQGVEVPLTPVAPPPSDTFTFLLPAGIRPVKNVMFPLEPLAALHEVHPQIRLVLVGPVIDPAYGAEVMEAIDAHPFAQYHGAVGHEAMHQLYAAAHVVLNSSHSEGGMANSILEAFAHGRPVLASSIEGNRSIIKEGCTGLLYRDEAEFQCKAELLISDSHLREKLAKNALAVVREKNSPEKEAEGYLELYREIVGAT